jgi:hypothetical protein
MRFLHGRYASHTWLAAMHLTQGSYASRAWLPVKSSPVNLYRGAGMGVGVGGGGSQILDQVDDDDDDDDDDGLPISMLSQSLGRDL